MANKYKVFMRKMRLLLKLSGEIMGGKVCLDIASSQCRRVALAIASLKEYGYQIGVVIGGGNVCRGISLSELGMRRQVADQVGMLATLINGLALQDALIQCNCDAILMSAIECPKVAELYRWDKAQTYLDSGIIAIFAGGTGNPYFTTDTAAALRANEINADLLLKATKVDGIYDKDPLLYHDAIFYEKISYSQCLAQKLQVMDATSIALCMSSFLPIRVFNMQLLYSADFPRLLLQGSFGTLISGE